MKPVKEREAYANLTLSIFANTVKLVGNPKRTLGSDTSPSRQVEWLRGTIEWTYGHNVWFDMADTLELCSTVRLRERIRELAFKKIEELERVKSNRW